MSAAVRALLDHWKQGRRADGLTPLQDRSHYKAPLSIQGTVLVTDHLDRALDARRVRLYPGVAGAGIFTPETLALV